MKQAGNINGGAHFLKSGHNSASPLLDNSFQGTGTLPAAAEVSPVTYKAYLVAGKFLQTDGKVSPIIWKDCKTTGQASRSIGKRSPITGETSPCTREGYKMARQLSRVIGERSPPIGETALNEKRSKNKYTTI